MHNILLPLGLIILLGALFRRFRIGGLDPDLLRHAIGAMVLNIFLPALCFKIIYSAKINIEAIYIPMTAAAGIVVSTLAAVAVYSLISSSLRITKAEKGALIISAAFGNVAYLGIPVLTGLYGFEAARYAIFYDLMASTPLLWTLGAFVASVYGGERITVKESLKTIVLLPPIWAIAAALLFKQSGLALPEFAVSALSMLSGLVVPLMTFSVGLALTMPGVRHAYAAIPAIIIKLAIVPLISFTAAYMLGLSGDALSSCVIEGAMPTMVLSLLLASRFRLDVAMAAFMIVVTTLLSFVTLPIVVHITSLFRQ
ncbi:MAG: AEC family transporter [Nitrospiraceae bacterium]|nr:AEC family transporter [Nitrospiraceae bacterium]